MRQKLYVQPIAKTPESVWAYIADLRNDRLWRREVTAVRLLSGSPPAPAEYEATVEWEGLKANVALRVVESVRGRRVVIETGGEGGSDYYSRAVWTFEPQGDGTLASLSFSFEARGPLHVAEPFMWPAVSGWLERDLPALEAHLSGV
jgi:hypothetical protein